MHIMTQLYRINNFYPVLKENFTSNKRRWEITDADTENTYINEGHYFMQNKSIENWKYYKIKTLLKSKDNFVIDTTIELIDYDVPGHFGLVWGFNKDVNLLNKFTISVDAERSLMMFFDKNYRTIYSRYQCKKLPKINIKKPIRFSIIKLGVSYYFLVNNTIISIIHESQFIHDGPYLGYYIEPGLKIKSKYLTVKRINAMEMDVVSGLNMLLDKMF
ncbi:MAG: hypothetical protein WCH52_06845 [Bacteroidota bacterium]